MISTAQACLILVTFCVGWLSCAAAAEVTCQDLNKPGNLGCVCDDKDADSCPGATCQNNFCTSHKSCSAASSVCDYPDFCDHVQTHQCVCMPYNVTFISKNVRAVCCSGLLPTAKGKDSDGENLWTCPPPAVCVKDEQCLRLSIFVANNTIYIEGYCDHCLSGACVAQKDSSNGCESFDRPGMVRPNGVPGWAVTEMLKKGTTSKDQKTLKHLNIDQFFGQ